MASICGFLPETPEPHHKKTQRALILGIFGVNDPIVPSFLAEHALAEMKNHGHESKIHETTQGHELSIENLNQMNAFFCD